MIRASTFVAMLLLGCAGRGAPAPPPGDLVARCAEVVSQARTLFPTEKYTHVATHCVVPMLHEPVCRDAIMRSLQIDPATRASLVTRACAGAYCPHLDDPRPGLCTRYQAALTPSELLPLAAELFARVRVLELGAAEAERWDRLVVGFPTEPDPVVAPPIASGPLKLRLAVQDAGLVVVLGEESWQLTADPGANDFDVPARRVAQLADRDDPVIIEVGPRLHYHHLIGMLNALGARNIRNISIASTAAE